MIAVVIPTIDGREALLERTLAAYRATTPELVTIVVRNRPGCGYAWTEGADAAAEIPEVRYIHMAADDLEPHPGWAEAASAMADAGYYPSPRILNADGTLHSCGTMGGGMLLPECATHTPCGTSPFPFFRAADWANRIGPGIEAHYYADDHFAWRARHFGGYDVAVCREFCLTHIDGKVGITRVVARSAQDRARFLAAVAEASPVSVEVAE